MNTTQTATKFKTNRVAFSAKQTQLARQRYWAARVEGNAHWIQKFGEALRISRENLIWATGSEAAADQAEIAYIKSLTDH